MLNIRYRKPTPRTFHGWTPEKDALLKQFSEQVARRLGRTVTGVQTRRTKLRRSAPLERAPA